MSSTTTTKRVRNRNVTARSAARRTTLANDLPLATPVSVVARSGAQNGPPVPATGNSTPRVSIAAAQATAPGRPAIAKPVAAPSVSAAPLTLARGRPGDSLAVYHLLLAAGAAPSSAEFQAEQDHPAYDPARRLVVKDRERLLGQVYLARRSMLFGGEPWPVAQFSRLAVLPDVQSSNLPTAMLAAAERELARSDELVALASAESPELFLSAGWAPLRPSPTASAPARHVLAALQARVTVAARPLDKPPQPYRIRGWRHVEQDGLMRIFAASAANRWGPWQRDFDYWRWLVSRQAFDAIYVAIDGPDRMDLSTSNQIVGYAVVKQPRILELLAAPDHPLAAEQLLARVCGDAIERGAHAVRLDAPADDPRLALFEQMSANSLPPQNEPGALGFAKVLRPVAFLQRLLPQLHERARAAAIELPTELGLAVAGEKVRLELTRREARLSSGKLGRSHLAASIATFTRLVLGQLDVARAVATGTLEASTRHALDLALVLFPRVVLWRPSWDELEA